MTEVGRFADPSATLEGLPSEAEVILEMTVRNRAGDPAYSTAVDSAVRCRRAPHVAEIRLLGIQRPRSNRYGSIRSGRRAWWSAAVEDRRGEREAIRSDRHEGGGMAGALSIVRKRALVASDPSQDCSVMIQGRLRKTK